MEKYERLKPPQEPSQPDLVKINRKTPVRNYIKYITDFFNGDGSAITIKAMGDAIPKILSIVEIIKHTVKGLHQITNIDTLLLEDIYEPLEDGLDRLIFSRRVPQLVVVLTKEQPELLTYGYQEPVPEDQVFIAPLPGVNEVEEPGEEGGMRRGFRGRGGRGGIVNRRHTQVNRAGFRGGFRGRYRGERGNYGSRNQQPGDLSQASPHPRRRDRPGPREQRALDEERKISSRQGGRGYRGQ